MVNSKKKNNTSFDKAFNFFFGAHKFITPYFRKKFGTVIGILLETLTFGLFLVLNVYVYFKIANIYKRNKAIKCNPNEKCCSVKGETDTYSCRQNNSTDNQCDRVTENAYTGDYECDNSYSELESGKKIELVVLFILFFGLLGLNLYILFKSFGLLGFLY